MASNIVELFGYSPTDKSESARQARADSHCPFLDGVCVKTLRNGDASGVCTLKPKTSGPVICCPYRLYANDYKILKDVAIVAFGGDVELCRASEARNKLVESGKVKVAVFGKRWGKELRLPSRGKSGGYFVDWVLAQLDENGELVDFVAVEVQSIDTTGNYQGERRAYLAGLAPKKASTAGFNWENVNKRILPQLIYKGHVLRRERLCRSGLFFICPKPVNDKIRERLGGELYEYSLQPGSLSLMWYDLGDEVPEGQIRELVGRGVFTTTVDQVANAFTSPSNLPVENVYRDAILAQL
ncbi:MULTISPECIES: NotI family restriction endonuclease [Pseudomonas]|uniref:NotI family restriction endonuclease n=1 Tax=Pseudomonas TaxID=286 RepID=UPI002B4164A3|nr:NotI family restriction endonuclease [Pseudomonas sichuanensis]